VITPTGAPFVDAGIVGGPPKADDAGPRFYASGPHAQRFATLKQYGLDIRVLEGAISAASALKMSYAGIMKGTQAIGTAMLLAAARSGNADMLYKELQHSQKEMLWWLNRQLAIMPPKVAARALGRRDARDFRVRQPGLRRPRIVRGCGAAL
jgi:putative dehydrogenase